MAGVGLVVIGRPRQEAGMSLEEVIKFLKYEMNLQDKWKVSLVGIGMGTAETLTAEGKEACKKARLLIGAKKDAGSSRSAAAYVCFISAGGNRQLYQRTSRI